MAFGGCGLFFLSSDNFNVLRIFAPQSNPIVQQTILQPTSAVQIAGHPLACMPLTRKILRQLSLHSDFFPLLSYLARHLSRYTEECAQMIADVDLYE